MAELPILFLEPQNFVLRVSPVIQLLIQNEDRGFQALIFYDEISAFYVYFKFQTLLGLRNRQVLLRQPLVDIYFLA